MNIAFIGAFTGVGGIQKTSALIASELSSRHNVFYIDYRSDDMFRFPLNNNVKTYNVASAKNKGRRIVAGDKIGSMYQTEIESITDILKCNNIGIIIFTGSFCTALISEIKDRLPDIKTIAWQHNSFEQYLGRYSEKYRDEYFNGLARADIVVCLTKHDESCFKELNKCTVCIGTPIQIQHSSQCAIENKRLLTVGRIEMEQKGLDLLLDAFSIINTPEWALSIVGNGNDMQKLSEKKDNLKNKDSISLKGYLPTDNLLCEYQNSSIFIMSSRWEGFPLTLLEAMSFGLPILSTPFTSAKEVLGSDEYGLLSKSFSTEDIAEAMQTMIDGVELRQHYSAQSLKRVADFTLPKIMTQWYKIFEKQLLEE